MNFDDKITLGTFLMFFLFGLLILLLLCQCKSDSKPENVYCATEHTLHLLCRGQFKEPFGVRLEPGECISTPRPCETLTVQPEYVISSTLVINGDKK